MESISPRGLASLENHSMRVVRIERDAYRGGFTLVELMVVLAIIVTIMTIVFANQSDFNKSLILANTAYDIALTLRSAATYGQGSRVVGSDANVGYGLNFVRGVENEFTFFADTYPNASSATSCHPKNDPTTPDAQPGNCSFDPANDQTVLTYTMGNGIVVSDFCALSSISGWSCAHSNGGGLTSLDIIYARPNADPFMSVNGLYVQAFPITRACLTISSAQGGERYIAVESSGAITARAASCP